MNSCAATAGSERARAQLRLLAPAVSAAPEGPVPEVCSYPSEAAEAAALLVDVEYEELPAVLDVHAALADRVDQFAEFDARLIRSDKADAPVNAEATAQLEAAPAPARTPAGSAPTSSSPAADC